MLADVRKADTSVTELTELMAGGADLAQLSAELMGPADTAGTGEAGETAEIARKAEEAEDVLRGGKPEQAAASEVEEG